MRLLGERADARSWLSAFDIFALPSLWEGLPNALLEAMAAGLPALASGVDGVCEVITPDDNGLLVSPGDATALARALSRLAADPDLRRGLGANARSRIVSDFTLPAMIGAYADAYSAVLTL